MLGLRPRRRWYRAALVGLSPLVLAAGGRLDSIDDSPFSSVSPSSGSDEGFSVARPFPDVRLGTLDDYPYTSPKYPSELWAPQHRPYALGWSAEVTPETGLFPNTSEMGGVALDLPGHSVYAGTRDGILYCLGPGGAVKWKVDLGGEVVAPPSIYKEYVLVGTSEGVLHILNKVTGERVARGILGEQLITEPLVVELPGGVHRVYVGSGAESVFSVELETGQKVWRAHRDAPSGFSVYGMARPVVLKDRIYIGYADGYIECRDAMTGIDHWDRHVSPKGEMQDIDALGTNGLSLFAASYSGGVFGLDPESGSVQWQTALPQANRLVVDGTVVYAGGPGLWLAMSAGDGSIAWRFHFGEDTTTTKAIVSDRFLAFALLGGPLYFIDKRTGQPAGQFATGAGFDAAPTIAGPAMATISNGGRVYTLTVAQ